MRLQNWPGPYPDVIRLTALMLSLGIMLYPAEVSTRPIAVQLPWQWSKIASRDRANCEMTLQRVKAIQTDLLRPFNIFVIADNGNSRADVQSVMKQVAQACPEVIVLPTAGRSSLAMDVIAIPTNQIILDTTCKMSNDELAEILSNSATILVNDPKNVDPCKYLIELPNAPATAAIQLAQLLSVRREMVSSQVKYVTLQIPKRLLP